METLFLLFFLSVAVTGNYDQCSTTVCTTPAPIFEKIAASGS